MQSAGCGVRGVRGAGCAECGAGCAERGARCGRRRGSRKRGSRRMALTALTPSFIPVRMTCPDTFM